MKIETTLENLKLSARSKVFYEVTRGKWKRVVGPKALLETLPYGGEIRLGLAVLKIDVIPAFGGRCDVEGHPGGYRKLNGFDLRKAEFEDVK